MCKMKSSLGRFKTRENGTTQSEMPHDKLLPNETKLVSFRENYELPISYADQCCHKKLSSYLSYEKGSTELYKRSCHEMHEQVLLLPVMVG